MEFFPTPNNPVPGEPVLTGITTADGIALRVAYWKAETDRPKGTVCILHGRAEFIEKYFETVGDLLARGFAVATFDWRGQGLSGRQVKNPRKGHVRRFADYRLDLEAVRDQILVPHMPEPHFALAHSMGGAIALNAAHESWLPFRRLVTTTPMIALSIVRRTRGAAFLARLLRLSGMGRTFVPGGGETSISTLPFKGNRLTSDPVRYSRNADAATAIGPGAIGAPTVAWMDSAFRFMRCFTAPNYALKIRLPTLIVAAGGDPVCATPATERFAARLKAGHAIVIPGARHEILMERDEIREQFWAAFDAFIPGTPDDRTKPAPDLDAHLDALGLSAEQLDGGGVDPAVASRDDAPAAGR
ncbi:alpha/beta fold hydrolase [Microvirga sp. M2]|uniref:alpha/beta fold hydrolase n=1 Tax=Microvirga sp. M2 TaxID=3073270 RepID=UPI0039C3B31A